MEYKELIRDLYDMLDGIDFGMCRDYSMRCVDNCESKKDCIISKAVEAIKELQARTETAEQQNAQLKKDLSNWSYNCNAMLERAQQFKRERDAAHALIKQDMHQEGTGELVTCFGYPLEKVRELVEADKVGRCFILTDERIKKANEMFKSWLFGDKEE